MVVLNELRNMFWGVTLDGGKRYTQTVERSFHISMAALEYPSTEGSLSPVSLMVNIDKAEFLLCTLGYGNVLQQPLDLMFTEGEEVTFFLNGSGIVHLTGYLVEDQPEDMSMYSEDISSGDEESDDVPALVGEDSDEDDDDDEDEEDTNIRKALFEYGKKRKMKDKDSKSNKKIKMIQADDDDDDDSDDEDFEIEDFEDDDDDDDSDMLELEQLENLDEESSDEDSEEERVERVNMSTSKKQSKQENKQSKKQEQKKKEKTPNTDKQKSDKKLDKANVKDAVSSPSNKVESIETTEGKKKKKKKKKKNANTEDGQKAEAETPGQKATPAKRVLAGGTIAEELKTGHGPEARPGKMVSVYYVGKLSANGKQFDSCKQGKPFKFRLGKSEVIKGWDLGVTGMKVGGRRRLTVPPQQGYGGQRQGPIPPNSTLVFEVELKAVS